MNAAALYDLDGEKSVKTVHKAKEATKRGGAGNSEEEEDNLDACSISMDLGNARHVVALCLIRCTCRNGMVS